MTQIPFRIINIQVEKFEQSVVGFVPESSVEVRTGYEFGVNKESHLVNCRLSYTYIQNDNHLLDMVLACAFDVKPDAFAELMKDDGTFVLEPFFSQYLATINVGAARGEIHARCEAIGSPLQNVILPPINLMEALPEPIVIKFQ